MHILHAYKIYRPDIDGGIPAAISSLAYSDGGDHHSVLAARRFGAGCQYTQDGVPVEAVTSFGTLLFDASGARIYSGTDAPHAIGWTYSFTTRLSR